MRRHAGLFICLIHLCSPDMSHGRGQVQLGILEEYVTFEVILEEEWAVKVNVCYESCRVWKSLLLGGGFESSHECV